MFATMYDATDYSFIVINLRYFIASSDALSQILQASSCNTKKAIYLKITEDV